ncbi:MAG: DUF2436 domain-containing protein [Muribaculaceae bacterium]|nr:DUF2436 domain-containing protein [Muribaculaceae bacterium]
MKKLLFLLLTLTVAISASAGIDQARKVRRIAPKAQPQKGVMMQTAKHTNYVTPFAKPATAFKAPAKVDIPAGYCAVTLEAHLVWYSEETPDYSGYQMLLDADATAYGVDFEPTGGSGTFTGSYSNFEYKIPENADPDLDTENIVNDGSVTILIPAGTYDYVIVNPTPNDRLWIASNYGNVGGRGDDFTFYEGVDYRFTLALGDNGNDFVTLTAIEPGRAITTPENLNVHPGDVYANVVWDDNDDVAWNLRWRPWTDTGASGGGVFWDFPVDDLSWLSDWYTVDVDGDEHNWEPTYLDSEYTNAGWYSESYTSDYESLDPDNWLISPEVTLNGTLTFTLGGVYRYPDHMGVFAVIGWDPETGYAPTESDLIYIGDYYCSDTESETTITADLSQFDGQVGRLIFRHYDSYDCYYLYIDNIQIGEVIEPAPWNYVNGIDATNYRIEDLTPNTKYEVQVQADGMVFDSEWTNIVEFTTLAEMPNVYILGEVNEQGWAPNAGTQMTYDAEDNLYTATVTLDGRNDGYNYFSFTTELAMYDDGGSWDYIKPFRFGAVSEGDFEFMPQYDGQPIDITYENGQAFKVPAGEYDIVVDLANMKAIITSKGVVPEVLKGDVNDDHVVNISDAIALITAILNSDLTGINIANADVDESTEINITDAIKLINYVLNEEW